MPDNPKTNALITFDWEGNLDDDCTVRVGEWCAHVELQGDFWMDPGDGFNERTDYWFCAVYRGDEQWYHSGEAGGFITSGEQCRAIAEAIIRAGLLAQAPDLTKCPTCGGPADMGFSRDVPPVPHLCGRCDHAESLDAEKGQYDSKVVSAEEMKRMDRPAEWGDGDDL